MLIPHFLNGYLSSVNGAASIIAYLSQSRCTCDHTRLPNVNGDNLVYSESVHIIMTIHPQIIAVNDLSQTSYMINIVDRFNPFDSISHVLLFHHRYHVNEITHYPIFHGNHKLKWYLQVLCCVTFPADVTYRQVQFIGCVKHIITDLSFVHPVC